MRATALWQRPLISLAGEVGPAMIERFDAWVREQLKAETKPTATTLLLTSGGGPNNIGRGLYDRLVLFQSVLNIHLVGIGMVGSAALYLSMAVPRNRRLLTPNTTVFMHQAQQDYAIPYKGSLSAREHHIAEARSDLSNQRVFQRWMVGLLAREMALSVTTVNRMVSTQTYMSASTAVDHKLFSSIIRP